MFGIGSNPISPTYSPIAQVVSVSDFESENTGSNPVRVARGRQKDKSNAMEKWVDCERVEIKLGILLNYKNYKKG